MERTVELRISGKLVEKRHVEFGTDTEADDVRLITRAAVHKMLEAAGQITANRIDSGNTGDTITINVHFH